MCEEFCSKYYIAEVAEFMPSGRDDELSVGVLLFEDV